ncbi:MAG: hypothetical protein B7Y25_06635 [Alphaproteobacteria bacterium 16-39-46]|nr:MAG: hypothetical protein B7Y25_06635 [Alphaproteobacteria bacterium 16-39-46]OZA42234.1 MAG: hypothetical protein B7X84_06710 [Alphaproteobacteria bacterium 17-39-52]
MIFKKIIKILICGLVYLPRVTFSAPPSSTFLSQSNSLQPQLRMSRTVLLTKQELKKNRF